MKDVIQNENGEVTFTQDNGSFKIHRTNECHMIMVRDAMKYGIEKACILSNISGHSMDDISKIFPYIEEKRLKILIDELFQDKVLQIGNEK